MKEKYRRKQNRKFVYIAVAIILLASILIAFDESTNLKVRYLLSQKGDVSDYSSLTESLDAIEIKAEFLGEVSAPFFSVEGKEISINDKRVQVFEHLDVATTNAKAELIEPDGNSIGTRADDGLEISFIQWGGTPHIYKKGKLIVIYVGDDRTVQNILSTVLGTQIAGG